MSWRVRWSDPAIASLHRIPWRDAARVARAVYAFAETGAGDIVQLPHEATATYRLRVRPHGVRLSLDPIDGELHVWMVYRLPR
jgi:hypothetical protein